MLENYWRFSNIGKGINYGFKIKCNLKVDWIMMFGDVL